MITNELSLEVSKNNNPKIMRLYDTSFYYSNQKVENYLIEVLPVNKTNWYTFHVNKEFSLVLNSSNLHYKKVNKASDLIDLPDGIYEIKQSIKPNIQTVQHYYHFRIVNLYNKIMSKKSELISNTCKISNKEYIINRDKLRDIEEYALAAKWSVEEDLNKTKGKELYDFAKSLLEKYSNECGC